MTAGEVYQICIQGLSPPAVAYAVNRLDQPGMPTLAWMDDHHPGRLFGELVADGASARQA